MNNQEPKQGRWFDTYADDIVGKDTPEMSKAIDEYAKRRHERTSAQNEDELCRWKEENDNISREYQWVKPEEYADIAPRIGRIMHYTELINTLRSKCGLRCFYRDMGHPQKIALWVQRNAGQEPELGCWTQAPYCTEFSVMRFDDHGVPLDERYRGWRTVLMQLALKGMLKESVINKVFGRANGPASEKYNHFMYDLRKNGLGLA